MTDINKMTLREKICQTVIINDPDELIKKYGGYEKLFEKYPVGGIYLGGSIVGGYMPGTGETFKIQEKWNEVLKIPPIYCGDFEGGSDGIHEMALGAANDEELAYRSAREDARLFANAGRQWIFGPVADLAMSIFAPINIRSLGDDPEKVSKLLCRMIEGMSAQKVAATAKHFPGFGKEAVDTHLTRLSIGLSKEEWDKTYRKIYKSMIDHGLMAVMTAHASLPCYQKECNEYGETPIATVSKELISDLLKDDLGFEGVVVTDGLIMGGAGGNNVELAIDAFCAGHDMLLWPDLEYVDVLEEKIKSGEIPMERLDDAVRRILRLKEFVGAGEKRAADNHEPYAKTSEIAEKSATLLNNRKNVIPLNPEKIKKVLLIYVAKDETSYKKLTYLEEVFKKRGIEVATQRDTWIPRFEKPEKEADLTVFACFEGPSVTPGPITLNGENGASVWTSQTADKEKTVAVSFGSPFLYNQYYRHYPTYMNFYSDSKPSCEAFVKALFGEIECMGESPVNLDKAF